MDVDLTPLANLLPWLPLAGAVMGLLMRQIRLTTAIGAGFGLLFLTLLGAALTVGTMGLALGWDRAQWLGAPLGVLILTAMSNGADSLLSHTVDKVAEVKAKKRGEDAEDEG